MIDIPTLQKAFKGYLKRQSKIGLIISDGKALTAKLNAIILSHETATENAKRKLNAFSS